MCTMTHLFLPAGTPATNACAMHFSPLHEPSAPDYSTRPPLFQVVPAGTAFFHIKETATGRVRGFREDHNQACALARSLEARIELLA